jgi:hypothetical protein
MLQSTDSRALVLTYMVVVATRQQRPMVVGRAPRARILEAKRRIWCPPTISGLGIYLLLILLVVARFQYLDGPIYITKVCTNC